MMVSHLNISTVPKKRLGFVWHAYIQLAWTTDPIKQFQQGILSFQCCQTYRLISWIDSRILATLGLSSRPRYVHAYAGMDVWSIISSSNCNNEFLPSGAVNFQTYRFISISRVRYSQHEVYLGCVLLWGRWIQNICMGAWSIILSST